MLQNLKLTAQNKILMISFAGLLGLWGILSVKNGSTPSESAPEKNKTFYADTLIPKGFVLIPIELANAEAVSGLIDQFGVVDLYSGPENNSLLVASKIKILRAPLNPNKYAVMVSETLSQDIMKLKGPLSAVVQNRFAKDIPQKAGKDAEIKPAKPAMAAVVKKIPVSTIPVEIEYYQGGSR